MMKAKDFQDGWKKDSYLAHGAEVGRYPLIVGKYTIFGYQGRFIFGVPF